MAGKKVATLTAEDPPKLVARVVSRALGLDKELGRDALPKDVLAAARRQMPKVAIPRGTLPKDALLLIAGAISAQQQAQEAAEAKKRRQEKRAKAQHGAMGELPPSDSDSEDEYEDADEVGEEPTPEPEPAAQFTTDKRGNSISVAEAERRKAEQAEREAAAARRAAKAAAAEQQPKSEAATLAEQLATARAKAAA